MAMDSGSSCNNNSALKGFDFATDDILCSYEDYANHEASNGSHSDSGIVSDSAKVLNFSDTNGCGIILQLWKSNPKLVLRGFIDMMTIDEGNIVTVINISQELKVLNSVMLDVDYN